MATAHILSNAFWKYCLILWPFTIETSNKGDFLWLNISFYKYKNIFRLQCIVIAGSLKTCAEYLF